MLIHHSNLAYDVAASEAAASARAKMEALFKPGLRAANTVLEHVQAQHPTDYVVPAQKLEVIEDVASAHGVRLGIKDEEFGLVKHSFTQLCTHAGFPVRYAQDLLGKTEVLERRPWAVELLARNLRELYQHDKRKFLVRSVRDDARGILSDSYRRLDCRPLFESFALACQHLGAVPVDGHATETKVELKAMLPVIFEPVPNEVMCFGLSWSNSDFGNGAHSLRTFVLRLVCTNKAVADEQLRQIHLGKRLSEDTAFSERTYQLDTQTTASALYDVVGKALSPDTTNAYMDRVRKANEEQVDRKLLPGRLARLDLTKNEVEEVVKAYDSADVEMIPPGNTTWRLSNAISWFAGNRVEDEERRMELERVAGKVLPGSKD